MDILVGIKGNTFKMVFNLKVFRTLGKVWNLPSLPEVMERVSLIENIESGSFEVYEVLYDLIFQAIDCCPGNQIKISKEEIENLEISELMELAQGMTEGITASFPDSKTEEDTEKKITAPEN
ncbi:hypothetical protein [Flavobacterium johnsoniae]|uniref:Tail assembly chaperone n=1 Tax=Flavobacterium johnsoniae TaxID=986 RepID=A0A1M5IH45_FLAJO|nr:hypothetical protein [Flavobacterium johnsoniae]SHG27632.1 hypothetical protein SAMN05444388_102100 [Flavobacterium johnsoniae]